MMKSWSAEDWVGLIVGAILVGLMVGWIITISGDLDTVGSTIICLTWLIIAFLLIEVVTNIISGSDVAKMIIRMSLILASMMFYEVVSNFIWRWTA